VSTIRQDRVKVYGYYPTYRPSIENSSSHSVASSTVVRKRHDSMTHSLASSSAAPTVRQRSDSLARSIASSTAAPTVSTIRQNRVFLDSDEENTTVSSVPQVLPFRKGAPVRPTEQNQHRAPPGALCLSPMQRTPVQARKWRDLAMAAQEKDSKRNLFAKNGGGRGRRSLSERHPNIVSHQ
jgi:hypothetical protein